MGGFRSGTGGRWWWVAVAFVLGCIGTGRCGCFTAIDGRVFDGLTRDSGFQGAPGVCRSGPGTKLFLTGQTNDGATLLQIVSREGIAFKRFASGPYAVDDDGNPVAWATNLQAHTSTNGATKALAFATGEEIPVVVPGAFPSTFEFSPGGEFFLLDQPAIPAAMLPGWASAAQPVAFLTANATNIGGYAPRWQAVFLTSQPTKPLFRLPNDFYGHGVFTWGDLVVVSGFKFVFGTGSKPGRPDLQGETAWALAFGHREPGYELTRQLDLSRFTGVLDMDPVSGMLLVRGKGEIFADWGLFDPRTGKYKSLGRAGAHGLFLDCQFSNYLGSRFH